MTQIFLVRHGPTHATGMVGWSDLPADLSDRAALARLDAHLPKDALVVSSDLSRAKQTANAIQGQRQRLSHEHGLREIHFGDWELLKFDEVEDQDLIRSFWDQPGDVRPPNGESWNQVCTRVDATIDRLLATNPLNDLIIVAHFGAILTQVQRAAKLTAFDTFSNRINNLSLTTLSHHKSIWSVQTINHNL
ncbi:histidine phosphatase family protein [Cognatishimia sp. WU-CL00825]|uniref:histidine phosphatase family protein n=1 Tax=Cognatishimia sp. WU-CL00825 TaxID=3127658 RepID=UPI003103FFD3